MKKSNLHYNHNLQMAAETAMPKIWDLNYSGLAGSIRGLSCTIYTCRVMNAMSEEVFLKNFLLALFLMLLLFP